MKSKMLILSVALQQILLSASVASAQDNSVDVGAPIPAYQGSSISDLVDLLGTIAGWILYAAGSIAVIFLMVGGIMYITAAGDSAKTDKAKKVLIDALIGVVIIAISIMAVRIVTDLFN